MSTHESRGTVLDWSEEKLCSASSRPNDVSAGEGGGDDGGGADGGGADGGNAEASIERFTAGVASQARLSPTATAGVWPISNGGQCTSRTCTGGGLLCKVLWHTRALASMPRKATPLSQ